MSFALVPSPLGSDHVVLILWYSSRRQHCAGTSLNFLIAGKVCVIGGYAISGADVEFAWLSQHIAAVL